MKYIDIHCHLNLDALEIDKDEVIARAREKGIGMIVVGTNKETSEKAIKIAEENPDIWAIIGLHPVEVPCEVFDKDIYMKMAKHPKVVGIGECGFDYYRNGSGNKDLQREVFEAQIAIANEVKKPLMLHLRNSLEKKDNAYADAIEVLKKHAKVPGDVHFYAGNLEEARAFVELGFRISFTGIITFVRDFDEVITNIPLNMIMSETDAPFASPEPHRGERNEPAFVTEVAHKIAEIRGEPLEKILPHLVDNARKLFQL